MTQLPPPSSLAGRMRSRWTGWSRRRGTCGPAGSRFGSAPPAPGRQVTLWTDPPTVRLGVGGWRTKPGPSRLSEADLAGLRRAEARPAGPPPAGPSPGALAASQCVEVDRLVNGIGGVTLLNRLILVGSPLAGQRARIRLDGQLMHVLTQDGLLWRLCRAPSHPARATARTAPPA